MRLWSIHPRYLDQQGLVALWREGLLAQKVLAGQTKGYRFHPQLERFRECRDPLKAIGSYLLDVLNEAKIRNYRFDRAKIFKVSKRRAFIPVQTGQLEFERLHLLKKLKARSPMQAIGLKAVRKCNPHPLFRTTPGGVHSWERALPEREIPNR